MLNTNDMRDFGEEEFGRPCYFDFEIKASVRLLGGEGGHFPNLILYPDPDIETNLGVIQVGRQNIVFEIKFHIFSKNNVLLHHQ